MTELIFLIFLLLSCNMNNKTVNQISMTMCSYFLFRWITDYRKCTISYFECKVRGVPKEQGYLYQILNPIFDYNKSKYRFLLYIMLSIIFYINNSNLKLYNESIKYNLTMMFLVYKQHNKEHNSMP